MRPMLARGIGAGAQHDCKILSLRPKLKHGAFQRAMPIAAWELTRAP
jgi:hypothetical protein